MSLFIKSMKNPLLSSLSNHVNTYPTPINLSYLWGFGSLAGIALVVQIVTGVLLAMHYAAEIHLAFNSVEHIMRDVKGGAILRYIHANGASMFFIVVFTHIFRGLYYGSYFQPRANLWYSGILIFFLMMATAFMGYVLPWGQMSFWGATVITNLFSAIPGIGNSIVQLLWGGFSVDNPTLNRFFSLHYFVPFIIAGAAMLHLILLHQNGSNNPLGINSAMDRIPFYPYFYVKDLFGFFIFVFIFSFFVIYVPNFLGHPDNYIEANPLVTPAHIVPEWYFLPFYAVLRTIPDKLGGVLLMGIAIVILALLPVVDTSALRSNFFKPLNLWFFWYFFADSVSLGWIGQEIVESPFIEMANFVTFSYFAYFILFLPLAGFLENTVINYELRFASIFFINGLVNSQITHTNPVSEKISGLYVNGESSNLKLNFNFFEEGLTFYRMFGYNPVIQVISTILFIVFLAIFFKRGSFFIQTIHRIVSFYLLFIITQINLDTILNNHEVFDSLFANVFFFYAVIIVFFLFFGITDRFYIKNNSDVEFSFVVLFVFLAGVSLFYVHTLVDLILALEVITLSSYVLVAFERKNRFSTFAGVQYFILGSIPSAMLILGSSLLYKNWGTLALEDLDLLLTQPFVGTWCPQILENENTINFQIKDWNGFDFVALDFIYSLGNNVFSFNSTVNSQFSWEKVILEASPVTFITVLALILIFFNFLFKITAAPFHFWAPSIYGKAPIVTSTFLSIFLKGMVFFLIYKCIITFFYGYRIVITPFFIFCGTLSVLFGMIGAFTERYIKRFFVYSSMGHVGFMLLGLSLVTMEGVSATFHYLPIYVISSYVMWFVLLSIGRSSRFLTNFKWLKNTDKIMAFIFAVLIFSMSGIPPLGGFFVKFDILTSLMNNSRFYLNYLLFFFTVASFFYYLRLIKIMYFDNQEEYIKKKYKNTERLVLISFLFLILVFYIVLIQKPLLLVQIEALKTLF